MIRGKDTSFNDIRAKSVEQWLDAMSEHNDIEVRGGYKVTKEYIEHLKSTIDQLEKKSQLKDTYLKRLKKQ